MRFLSFVFFIFCFQLCNAQLNYQWGFALGDSIGGTFNRSVAVDNVTGHIILTGGLQGNCDVDPSSGVALHSAIAESPFIAKYTSSGTHIWSIVLPTDAFYSEVQECLVDLDHNIIVAGFFRDTLDFDPGVGAAIKFNPFGNGSKAAFVAKYDSSGNFLWVNTFDCNLYSETSAITSDQNGNVYFAGIYSDSLDIDPTPTVSFIRSISAPDGFIVKMNSSGQVVWTAYDPDFTRSVEITDMVLLGDNKLVFCGYTSNGTDLDFGAGITTAPFSSSRVIACYDVSGNFSWVKFLSGGGSIWTESFVAINSLKQIVLAGEFGSTIDLDPSVGVANHTATGIRSMFIGNYDSLGNYVWSGAVLGDNRISPYAIYIDGSDQIWISGLNNGISDYDIGGNTNNLSSASDDPFIAVYSINGDILAGFVNGTAAGNVEIGHDVTGNSGVIYWTGVVLGAADWDPESTTAMLSGNGATSSFLVAYGLQSYVNDSWLHPVLKTYPNPASDQFYYFFEGLSPLHTCVVVNANGEIVFEQTKAGNYGTVSTSDWASGIYHLIIQTEEFQFSQRVSIINN